MTSGKAGGHLAEVIKDDYYFYVLMVLKSAEMMAFMHQKDAFLMVFTEN